MSDLAERACVPCRGGVPPMSSGEANRLLSDLGADWSIRDVEGVLRLVKSYRFKDFREALSFVDRVGALADEQSHHPDVHLSWGRVELEIWTHKIHGLTESDFIFAAKCERLP